MKLVRGFTFAEGELLIIAVRTPKAWTVILSAPFSNTYMKIKRHFIAKDCSIICSQQKYITKSKFSNIFHQKHSLVCFPLRSRGN